MIRTIKQALSEAVKRWGKKAGVKRERCYKLDNRPGCSSPTAHGRGCRGGRPRFVVGRTVLIFFSVDGEGRTWDEAFTRADWRVHRDFCPKCIGASLCADGRPLKDAVEKLNASRAVPVPAPTSEI